MCGFASKTNSPPKNSTRRFEAAAVVDRRVGLQAVLQADVVVLPAVPRRGVHAAGARLEGHVRAEHDERVAVVERVAAAPALQAAGVDVAEHGIVADPEGPHAALHQVLGQDVDLARIDLDGGVGEVRVQRDGEVRGQRPGGGRPDDHRHRFPGERRAELGQLVPDRELHVHGGRAFVLVLDLGLGQRGLAGEAPVDGLLAADDDRPRARISCTRAR